MCSYRVIKIFFLKRNNSSYEFAEKTRVRLLKLCLREVVLHEGVDLKDVAAKLEGYSGSDISNLCR